MRHFNLHLPDEVRVFDVPDEGIRRRDSRAVVFDVAVTDQLVLRHYSFAHRWFEVNCTLDRSGRPVDEGSAFPAAFNCDMCTPVLQAGGDIYDVDLELDVLVSSDALRHITKDEEDFAGAVRQGWLDDTERRGALDGLADLLQLLRRGEFLPLLDSVCPFAPFTSSFRQPPPLHLRTDQVALLQPAQRRALYPRQV